VHINKILQMIRTVIIPKNNKLQVTIPDNYIGKEIEVFLYAKEELMEEKQFKGSSMSRFRGLLSAEEANQLQEYVKKSREEWDRNI